MLVFTPVCAACRRCCSCDGAGGFRFRSTRSVGLSRRSGSECCGRVRGPGFASGGCAGRSSWGEGGSRTGWFGQAWEDVDGDGCDTRNEILSRDLTDADYSRANGIQSRDEGVGQGAAVCPDATVWSGTLHDPYTGSTMPSSVARAPRRRFRSTMWCL